MAGALIGGWIASTFMSSPEAVAISEETVSALASHGYQYPEMDQTGAGFIPTQLMNFRMARISIPCALSGLEKLGVLFIL